MILYLILYINPKI